MKNIILFILLSTNLQAQIIKGDSILYERGKTYNTAKLLDWANEYFIASFDKKDNFYLGATGTGPDPVITSLKPVTGWVKVKTNVYRAKFTGGKKLTQVYIDDKQTPVARYPKTGYLRIDQVHDGFGLSSTSMPYGNFSGGEIVVRFDRFTVGVATILTDVGNKITYKVKSESSYGVQVGYGYFFQNHLNCLKAPGDWYANDTSITVYFKDDPALHTVEAATTDYLFYINSCKNFKVEGLRLKGANKALIKLQGNDQFPASGTFKGISGEGSNMAVEAVNTCSNVTWEGNTFSGFYQSVLNMGYSCKNLSVRNNRITGTGLYPGAYRYGILGSDIDANSDNVFIEDNYITNTGTNAITFLGEGAIVQRNYISGHSSVKDDGGGIYTYNAHNRVFTNWIIQDNIILNGKGAGRGTNDSTWLPAHGIYLDDNSNGGIVRNNISIGNAQAGVFVHNSYSNQITDNILGDNLYGSFWYQDGGKMFGNTYLNNRLLKNKNEIRVESIVGSTNFFK